MIIENKSYTGEDIEILNSIASDHLFMLAMQTNYWKNNIIFKNYFWKKTKKNTKPKKPDTEQLNSKN